MLNKFLSFNGLIFEPTLTPPWRVTFLPFNWMLSAAAVLLVLATALTSWHTVGPDENATVRIFGRYTETKGPGLFFAPPWPVATVLTTPVQEIRRIEIGYRTENPAALGQGGQAQYQQVAAEALMLTGDENLVMLNFAVQYRPADAKAWQFIAREPARLIKDFAQGDMRTVVGRTNLDQVMTTGRQAIESEAKEKLQKHCDAVGIGAKIVAIQLQDIIPPSKEVQDAFRDVNSAKEDKNKIINEAESYRNSVVPTARGNAAEIINKAKGYAAYRTQSALGEVQAFLKVAKEYSQNPDITAKRLILEATQNVLHGGEFVVDAGGGAGLLKFFNISEPADQSAPAKKTPAPGADASK
ncbi:MAG: FtsH protease activity modulator HflK [Desulfovibrionaceae bacterium]|nr:FtsH protease activity modulator HflK [Desulfovibrionaceae bacterium]MBF0513689.1 FtsH protease activity modulator HflK [Desulfovibrionaceae bacterium]